MNLAGSYGLPTADVTREFYFNVGGPHGFMRWGIYIFMFISMFYLIYTVVKRVLIWRQGKPQLRTDYPEKRILAVIKYVMLQAKLLREKFAGIMHASIFFGFLVLFVVTLIIVVQEDFTALFFHYHFLKGNFYLIWSLFGDLFGLIVFIGLVHGHLQKIQDQADPSRHERDRYLRPRTAHVHHRYRFLQRGHEDRDNRFPGI